MTDPGLPRTETELWSVIDAQRRRIAELLDRLSADAWDHPSLCAGWTVRDVAAHLTLQQLRPLEAIGMALRSGGSLNRAIRSGARTVARSRSDRQLIDGIVGTIGRHRPNAFLTVHEALVDTLVHGLDIAVPLGIGLPVPERAAAAALERLAAAPRTNRVFRDLPWRGSRLRATDLDWSVGEGDEIAGPTSALLLLVTGRPVALERLRGPGVARVRAATATASGPRRPGARAREAAS